MRTATLLLILASSLSAQNPTTPTIPPNPEDLFKAGRYDEARPIFAARVAKDKNDHRALFYMGRIAEETNKPSEAVDWYEKALKLNDTSATYHFYLGSATGDVAQNANKFKQPFLARKVKSEFERAAQLDPKMLEPHQGLADFYVMAPGIMGGSIEKAHAQAAEIKKLHPFRGYFTEARIASRQKNVAAEGKAYEDALAAAKVAAPDSMAPWYSLAAYYRRNNRADESFALYDSVLKRKPDEIQVHVSYGITSAVSGKNLERGERELKHYLEHPPKDINDQTRSAVHYYLGQIHEKAGRKDAARSEYNEAIKLNAKNEDAKKAVAALK